MLFVNMCQSISVKRQVNHFINDSLVLLSISHNNVGLFSVCPEEAGCSMAGHVYYRSWYWAGSLCNRYSYRSRII